MAPSEEIMDLNEPLTDAEFDRLADILMRFGDKRAMNLEMVDGFFAALICGPEQVLPSEYLPQIWGGEMINEPEFQSKQVLNDLIGLITKHWNAVSRALHEGDVYTPLLTEDENGIARANDWSNGFLRGMDLRKGSWAPLLGDDEHGGSLVPIFALAHENHSDPEMRLYKEPIDAEQREKLIIGAAAGVMNVFTYFEAERHLGTRATTTFRRDVPKVGRNDPCPCGSRKKFKQCCGKVTLH